MIIIYGSGQTLRRRFSCAIRPVSTRSFLRIRRKARLGNYSPADIRKLKADIARYYVGPVPDDAKILSDLKDARNYLTARDEWEQDKGVYLSLFAPVWKGEDTDPAALRSFTEWVLAVLTMVQEELITPHTIELLCSGTITPSVLTPLFEKLEKAVIAHSEARDVLFTRLGIQDQESEQTFASVRKLTDVWITEIDRLSEWSTFPDVCRDLREDNGSSCAPSAIHRCNLCRSSYPCVSYRLCGCSFERSISCSSASCKVCSGSP